MAIQTYRKTISSMQSGYLATQYTYAGLGASLEGLAALTHKVAPLVFIDNDTNRRLRPENIDTDGFDVYGDPGGDDPPYNVQIWIISSSIEATADLGGIKQSIRNTVFTFPNTGRKWNLWGHEGYELMPDPLLLSLINNSIKDINMEVFDDSEVYEDTMTVNQDYITLPNRIAMIKDVIVFAAAGDDKGYPMEPSATYDRLMVNGTEVTGRPDIYQTGKKTIDGSLTRYIQFNKLPDAAYPVEVHYWKIPDDVAADTDVPELFLGYHELVETRALWKVATKIGDRDRKLEFMADYTEQLARAKRLQSRFNAPMERVSYGII